MKKIKFSHEYPKLWKQTQAELIAVRLLDVDDIHDDLKEYDTLFDDNGYIDHYQIPKKGQLIQLIFYGNKQIPFCTLRRYTKEKLDYYKSLIGKQFEIVIEK